MLYIKGSDGSRGYEWHCGDGPIDLNVGGSVVQLVVDGHELEWLEKAIEVGRVEADKDYYKKVWTVGEN